MIVTCSNCGQRNRVPPEHLADRGRCGQCKNSLGPLAEPLDVTGAEFDGIVQGARVPILVDFWAAWCGPCRMAAPQVKATAAAMAGRALVLKVDTEAEPGLAQRFGIQGIPNFVVLTEGRTVRQQAGLVDSRQMQRWLQEAGA